MHLRKRTDSILAGSILHLHNEFQLGENSLARGIHAITQTEHNHGKSRPQTNIRQQRMDYIAYYECISGWGRDYGKGDNLKWFHSHVLVTVGCAADFTALSGGLSSKVPGKTTFASCHAGKKNPLHVTLVTCNRLNGPSKVLTATDGQQIKLTANYFSRFNHMIGKLPGHGHGRPSKTVK